MSEVKNGIVQRPHYVRRVTIDAGPNTLPVEVTYEVTRTPIDDEQPEIFGRPRDPDALYEYAVELISGDVEALSDLDNEAAEADAIRQAESDWAELAKLEGAA